MIVYVIRQNQLKLKKKDTEILYRDELFSMLSVNVDDVFLMLNAENMRVDYISPNIEKLMGIPEKQARSNIHAMDSLVQHDDTVRVLDKLPEIGSGEQGEWDREYVHQKTGEVRWFHVIALCSVIQGEKKYIIDMMGGTIEVHTQQGKGTEFVIRVALKLQSERRSVEKIKELEGLKALVVDDDFNTCSSVTKMLSQVGMRSEWTLYGKEAILRARQSSEVGDAFHAYIIDWRLPDMNGVEVTRQIRSLGDETPIIILTAYDWSDIEEEARNAGVTAFCSKPMFLSDLCKTLMTAIGQQEAKNGETLSFADGTPDA